MGTIKFNNLGFNLYMHTDDGSYFKVLLVTNSQDDANKFMVENPHSGLIATDNSGLHYIAELEGS